MTSQKDQIQALIAEIDSVLQRANPRLPWRMSGEVTQQRQVLERVRNYLVSVQQQQARSRSYGASPGTDFLSQDLYYQPSQAPTRSPAFDTNPSADKNTQQMLEKVLQEIAQLRGSLTPSHQPPLSAELLQVLINRLQERLSQQIAQALQPASGQTFPPRSDYMLAAGGAPPALSTTQYEQFQALRTRSDQMLVNLDSTINIVFESLQRNIQTYQDSLSQGLDRMYSLGQQSEVTFRALVELLIKQLQQDVVSATAAPPQLLQVAPPAVSSFPYAGAEIPATDSSQVDVTPPARPSAPRSPEVEVANPDATSAWMSLAGTPAQTVNQPVESPTEGSIPTLDLSDLNLEAAKFSAIRPNSPVEDVATNPMMGSTSDSEDTTEIDAALKLLENLSAELQTATSSLSSSISIEDAEDQLNELIRETPVAEEPLVLPQIPQDVHIELDEFYQSLFGGTEPETTLNLPPLPVTEPVHETAPASESSGVQPTSEAAQTAVPLSSLTLDGESLPIEPAATSGLASPAVAPVSTTATDFELFTNPEELFLDNIFETAPPLPPVPSSESESLFDDFIELEESPTRPDLESSTPDAIAVEAVRFTQLDQISSLADLFDTVEVEQSRSTPVEPPASASSQANAPLIEVPFERTYSELLHQPTVPPGMQPAAEAQGFGVADEFLEEEQYTRAAFDENLLPDAAVETVDLGLDVDDLTLNSLNEDLAGLENLGYESEYDFGAPAAIAQPVPSQPASAFTLDDFAADLSQPQQQAIETDDPSLDEFAAVMGTPPDPRAEASDDLFANFSEPGTLAAESLPGDNTIPFTLEGMDDLFEDAPPIDSRSTSQPSSSRGSSLVTEIPPFKPQLLGQNSQTEDLTPLQLEGLDNLFGEESPASGQPPTLELDEAFESLLGPIAPGVSTDETQPAPPPRTEKKKI